MKKQFKEYKIKLTVRACVLYEKLAGKPFFQFGNAGTTDEDAMKLMYACLVANNDVILMFDEFKVLYGDADFKKWMESEFSNVMKYNSQFNVSYDDEATETDEDIDKATMTNVASSLIAQHGMNPDYVMDRMGLYEINDFFKAIDIKEKSRLIEKRFWTYLTICPHIDSKKIKSPEKLVPFTWEKPMIKQRQLDDLKRHKEEAKQIIGKMDMGVFFRPPEKKEEVEND